MSSTSGVRQRKSARRDEKKHDQEDRDNVQSGTSWGSIFLLCIGVILGVPILLLASLALFVESPINAVPNILPEPPEWTGPLEPVPALLRAERMFDGKLFGPESIVFHKDHVYTGTMDGKILAINKYQMKAITHLGQMPCGGYDNEPTCGRPLGMRMDKDGHLIVLDTYLGMFKVNVATGDHHMLLSSRVEIDGKRPMFLNDLDIASDGTIYMSDSSIKFQRRQFPLSLLEASGDGRFIKYDLKKNATEVLLDGLHFANGVQLSKDEDYVLIVETTTANVIKYHLTGEKKGKSEVFIENLPCFADNIRRRKAGGFWIGCAFCRRAGHFSLLDYLGDKPEIRNFFAKIPSRYLLMLPIGPPCGMIIHVNEKGQIERMYNDPTNKNIIGVSEVEDDDGVLYLGSFKAPYLGKIDLRNLDRSQ